MANTKRRRRKKGANNMVLIVMLVIIIGVIAVFAIDAGKNKKPSEDTTAQSTEQGVDLTDAYQSEDEDDENNSDGGSGSVTDSPSSGDETEEASATTKESTTEPETLPLVQEPENVSDKVVKYYTDFMGVPDGSLFIKDSESKESATGYTFTLRLNTSDSPNKFIGDVYVEKGTGKVTDSMGNDAWYIS